MFQLLIFSHRQSAGLILKKEPSAELCTSRLGVFSLIKWCYEISNWHLHWRAFLTMRLWKSVASELGIFSSTFLYPDKNVELRVRKGSTTTRTTTASFLCGSSFWKQSFPDKGLACFPSSAKNCLFHGKYNPQKIFSNLRTSFKEGIFSLKTLPGYRVYNLNQFSDWDYEI